VRKQPIQCGAAISTAEETAAAIAQVCADAMAALGDARPHLAVLFFSPHHVENLSIIRQTVQQQTGADVVIGCTGESIVGTSPADGAVEMEWQPALSLFVASLPEVQLTPFHLQFERTPDGGTLIGWPDALTEDWPAGASLMVLGDPFSFPVDALLERVNEDHPGVPVFGGMASGAAAPGEVRLLLNDAELVDGALAVLFSGPLKIRNVVSQGCRPIGKHFVITKAERNIIQQLGGAPALQQLKEIFQTLPARDQQLAQQGLHVGRVMNEYQDQFEQGDFLIKNVVGIDPESGGIAIGDYVRVGQTVQFHVRDEDSADAELAQLLAKACGDSASAPAGALLFTCNGRGTRMFSTAHHDAAKLHEICGEIPLAGFFAQGELGPVAGKNFIHGFTASVALFGEVSEG
jgi:small ligand-binding sensory domain FIST